jgi:hypothetical protein
MTSPAANTAAAFAYIHVARTCLQDAHFAATAKDKRICAQRALVAAGYAMEVCNVDDAAVYRAAQEVMDAAVECQQAAR